MKTQKNTNNIQNLRNKIDKIDQTLLELLHKRLDVVQHIKQFKKSNKLNIFSAEREIVVMNKILKQNNHAFPEDSLTKIYNELFSVSRKMQKELQIGFLGPEGTFSHIAAESVFGMQSNYSPLNSFRDVFTELDSDQIDHGVVPIENSYEGIVGYTLDLLIEYSHYIVKEFYLEITNNIISKEKSLDKIKTIYTHPQPLGQCRTFIENTFKNIKIIETFSTSEAARLSAKTKNSGAISSKKAAEKYKMNILADKINDSLNNYTRFIVTSKRPNKLNEKLEYKTSVIIGVKDKPGALFSILEPFNKFRVNMTKIESRPTKKKAWEYIFFIEFFGKGTDTKVIKALNELEKRSTYLRNIGSYPKSL
jgi:chorismate mutase/prephenate dehydratase